jgi:hypothetical protein
MMVTGGRDALSVLAWGRATKRAIQQGIDRGVRGSRMFRAETGRPASLAFARLAAILAGVTLIPAAGLYRRQSKESKRSYRAMLSVTEGGIVAP